MRRSASGDSAAKKVKIAADTEHLASFDFLAALVHVLRLMTNEAMDAWFVEGPLDLGKVPRSLYMCMDWEQKQWRVLWFLRNQMGINLEGFIEIPHRRNNDLGLAIIEADFWTVRDIGFICANSGL